MSKIDELIKELCPNGVEYKELGEIGNFYGGLTGKTKEDFQNGNKSFITYKNVYSNISLDIEPIETVKIKENENQRTLEYGDIIFTGSSETPEECGFSSVVTKYPTKELYLNSFCFFLRLHNVNILDPNFSKHIFRDHKLRIQIIRTAQGVTRFNVSKEKMAKIKIPIPPLPIQREIVRILDSFTELTKELTEELTEELTARKKQYEFYRDYLLKPKENIPMVSLGNLCKIFAGGDIPKNEFSNTKTDEYDVPIISNGVGKNSLYGYTKKPKITEPAVTISSRGTIGYAEYRDYPYFPIVRLLSLIPNNKNELDTKYLYYSLQGKKYDVPITGIPQLTSPMIKKVKIPVPSLGAQRRLVHVLDNFDSICSDLKIGLPAEIEARQKQYEYYRDMLLAFAEKGEIIPDRQAIIRLIQYVFGFVRINLICLGTLTRGKRFVHADAVENGVPCIHYGELYTHYGIYAETNKSFIREELRPKMRYAQKGDVIIVGAGENNIDIGIGVDWEGAEDIAVHDACYTYHIDKELALPRYISYYLRTDDYHKQIKKYVSEGKICSISADSIGKAEISLPSLAEQKRIVGILDRFDSLCNDISSGLPAEIEARKKQYEYYRNKLLTFEKS